MQSRSLLNPGVAGIIGGIHTDVLPDGREVVQLVSQHMGQAIVGKPLAIDAAVASGWIDPHAHVCPVQNRGIAFVPSSFVKPHRRCTLATSDNRRNRSACNNLRGD